MTIRDVVECATHRHMMSYVDESLDRQLPQELKDLGFSVPSYGTGTIEADPSASIQNCVVQGTLIIGKNSYIMNCVIPYGVIVKIGKSSIVDSCTFKSPRVHDINSLDVRDRTVEIGDGTYLKIVDFQGAAFIGNDCFLYRAGLDMSNRSTPSILSKLGDRCLVVRSRISLNIISLGSYNEKEFSLGNDIIVIRAYLTVTPVTLGDGLTVLPYRTFTRMMLNQFSFEDAEDDISIYIRNTSMGASEKTTVIGTGFTCMTSAEFLAECGSLRIGDNVHIFGTMDPYYFKLDRNGLSARKSLSIGNNAEIYLGNNSRIMLESLDIGNNTQVRISGQMDWLGRENTRSKWRLTLPDNSINIL